MKHALELGSRRAFAALAAALAYAPDGRLFIAEKAGRVRVVSASGWLQPRPVIDISDHVNSYWDRGLLGIAVDASFASNHFLYCSMATRRTRLTRPVRRPRA